MTGLLSANSRIRWQGRPELKLTIETLPLSTWKLTIRGDSGELDVRDSDVLQNDLDIAVSTSLSKLPELMNDTAEALGVTWNTRAVDYSIDELKMQAPAVRRKLEAWHEKALASS